MNILLSAPVTPISPDLILAAEVDTVFWNFQHFGTYRNLELTVSSKMPQVPKYFKFQNTVSTKISLQVAKCYFETHAIF